MFWGTTHHNVCVLCLVRPPLVTHSDNSFLGSLDACDNNHNNVNRAKLTPLNFFLTSAVVSSLDMAL